ncbi:MAG TPA: twin-arginine translocase subunit TatC [Acidimicrobiales bacterium]|nr:twin-arginine translocase subunit TatC [Acidimicrobiales bacterium]
MIGRRRERAPVPDDGTMSVVEHLTEFRDRTIKSVLAIALGAVVCFAVFPQILEVLIEPYCQFRPEGDCQLIQTDPLEGFAVRLSVSAYGGIALAMPIVLYQVWRFITPGLHPHERRYALPFVVSGVLLFLLGATLAFYTVPRALEFLIGLGGESFEPFFSPSNYLGFLVKMMVAFGIGFEFPILLIFLQLARILTPQQLASWRRYSIVGIVTLVAVLTPSGDPISLMMLSVPMYLFYEAAIVIGRILVRRTASEPA